MEQDAGNRKWNKEQIEQHLKFALDAFTPDVFGRLDLSVPQDPPEYEAEGVQAAVL